MTANSSDPSPLLTPPVRVAPIVGAVALVAGIVRIPTLLAARHLSFDDGVYGASAIAMRHGALPFREVFSSQGPAFLVQVFLGDLLGLRTLNAPRVLPIISGMVIAGCVAFITARLSGAGSPRRTRCAAAIAGVLAALSGSLWWTTGPITAEAPTIAWSCLAVVAALYDRDRPTRWRLSLAAVCIGVAVAIKLVMAGPAAVVVLLLVGRHRRRDWVWAAVAGAFVPIVTTVAFGPQRVWRQVVAYHLESNVGTRNPFTNLGKLFTTLVDRDLILLVLFGMAGIVLLVATWRHHPRTPFWRWARRGLTPIAIWFGLTVCVLAVQHPLWRNHVAYAVVPMAIIVGAVAVRTGLGALAMLTTAVLLTPYHVAHTRHLWDPHGYRGASANIERTLQTLPPGAQVVSDDPGLVWRVGRRTPPDFVDTSRLRVESPIPSVAITAETVGAAARTSSVCAVVATAPVRFGALKELPANLTRAGYVRQLDLGTNLGVWVRSDCRPNDPARR